LNPEKSAGVVPVHAADTALMSSWRTASVTARFCAVEPGIAAVVVDPCIVVVVAGALVVDGELLDDDEHPAKARAAETTNPTRTYLPLRIPSSLRATTESFGQRQG